MRNSVNVCCKLLSWTCVLFILVNCASGRPRNFMKHKKQSSSGQLIIETAKQALIESKKHHRQARSIGNNLQNLLPDEPLGTKVVGFDVLLTPAQARLDDLLSRSQSGQRYKRKAVRFQRFHWPNGVVPYEFHSSVDSISRRARSVIQAAMRHWEQRTCLKFEPYSAARHGRDRMVLRRGTWCASKLGRVGGPQPLYLAWGCMKVGTIVHEIGHTVGWIHEQARPDRDEHVTIRWNMIARDFKDQYLKHHNAFINSYGVPYDYDSIMHYPSSGGEIVTKDRAYQHRIGQREKLSFYDAKLANLMYTCSAKCPSTVRCKEPGYVGPTCQCVCPDGTRSCDLRSGILTNNLIPGDDDRLTTTTTRATTTSTKPRTTVRTTPSTTTTRTTTTTKPRITATTSRTTTTTTTTVPTTTKDTSDTGCWLKLPGFFILGNNDFSAPGLTIEECAEKCAQATEFECKSFDYWVNKKRCYLSSKTRLDVESSKLTLDHRMVHYQKKPCYGTRCPKGFNAVDGRCVKVEKKGASFKDAQKSCREQNADLMIITQKSGRMLRHISDENLLPFGDYWVIAPKLTRDYWSTVFNFCSHVEISDKKITLDDNFCYKRYSYVCEHDAL